MSGPGCWDATAFLSSSGHIRNPERLTVNFDISQAAVRQVLFLKSHEGEVRQIAQHRLKPSVLGENFADSLVKKFVGVESQHGNVLRGSRRGNRVKHRL